MAKTYHGEAEDSLNNWRNEVAPNSSRATTGWRGRGALRSGAQCARWYYCDGGPGARGDRRAEGREGMRGVEGALEGARRTMAADVRFVPLQ